MSGRHLFIHVGDVHLQHGHPRNSDRINALDQVSGFVHAYQNDVAAVLVPGDLFHQKSTVEDRNTLAAWLQTVAAFAPVVLTYGNHDVAGDLDIFAKLETDFRIHVVDTPQVVRFRTRTDRDVAVFVLPYPHKAGLVAAGLEHDQLGQAARAALEPIFMNAAAELEDAARAGALTLAMMHVNIGGSLSSTGQPQIGREIELDPALLGRLGPIPLLANHIHRHQVLHGAIYAGSICRMDYGECEAKGFVVYEYATEGSYGVRPDFEPIIHAGADRYPWRASFIPLLVAPQIHVEGTLTRDAFRIDVVDDIVAEQVLWSDTMWHGADVRVRYRYKKSELGALDVAKIHAEFAHARSLKLDPVPDIEHDVRAPEVVAAKTLPEKVTAYCELNRIAVTDTLLAKLDQLQVLDADELLRAVTDAARDAGTVEEIDATREVA
jgi:DNA repair exonuclease SbcCD nuclease subunit